MKIEGKRVEIVETRVERQDRLDARRAFQEALMARYSDREARLIEMRLRLVSRNHTDRPPTEKRRIDELARGIKNVRGKRSHAWAKAIDLEKRWWDTPGQSGKAA